MRLCAPTRIGADVLTCLGDSSPRELGTSMPTHAVARSHMHRNRFPYFPGRCVAQTSMDASPRKVSTSTPMLGAVRCHKHRQRFPYFSGRCIAQKSGEFYADAMAACGHMHRHRFFITCLGNASRAENGEIYPDACGCLLPKASA